MMACHERVLGSVLRGEMFMVYVVSKWEMKERRVREELRGVQ